MNAAQLNEIAAGYAKAWNSGSPAEVTTLFAADATMIINRGHVLQGRAAIAGMVTGFYEEFPDLSVQCDGIRSAGSHAV
ncbi:MAG TPA: SgcJ/EcaC family oxidoreductase, partial [Rhizomicrobium sp.]|nr:SgcJ/EcaC family oxidoreductase [Rhizomicrobium sp.]